MAFYYNSTIYINNEPYMNFTTRLNGGNISCFSPGRIVYTDTWYACVAYQFPFILEKLGFGYITALMCMAIILMSIFGGIKENYKWIILNQALWDLLVSYDVICQKPTTTLYVVYNDEEFKEKFWNQGPPTCFYSTTELVNPFELSSWRIIVQQIFTQTLEEIQFSMTFSLAFSRFLAMYFPKFYQKHTTKNRKLLKILIIYNIFTVFLINFHHIHEYFVNEQIQNQCNNKVACYLTFRNQLWRIILSGIRNLPMAIWLLLSAVFTFAVFIKILKHIKFQYQSNQKSLISSIRISVALIFTSVIFFLYFLFIFTQVLMGTYLRQTLLQAGVNANSIRWLTDGYPSWISALKNTRQSVNHLRIFIECTLAFTLVTGYRRCCIQIIKYLINSIRNPKKALKDVKSKVGGEQSTAVLPYN